MLKKLLPCLFFISLSAISKETLTVYTYESFTSEWGPGPTIKQAFEQTCECELKFVALSNGVTLLNRLKMEGKNSPADVILGLDNNLIAAAENTGLFVPHHVDTSQLSLPKPWHNNTFLPYDYGYFAFIYNREKLQHPPTSLHELLDSTQPLKVIYQDPRTSTPGLGLLLWIQQIYGDNAPNTWQQLAKKTVTVTKGWSEAYGLFLKGEADMVLSYTTSPLYHVIEENNTRYAAANFSEGHYLQVEVAGVLASSQHAALAQSFMKFIITPPFQNVIPTKNWMYPVISSAIPPSYHSTPVPKIALEFTPQQVESQRAQWVEVWQRALSQ